MKLVVNAYMSTLIEGVAEAVELARRLGIDVAALDAAIQGGPLAGPGCRCCPLYPASGIPSWTPVTDAKTSARPAWG